MIDHEDALARIRRGEKLCDCNWCTDPEWKHWHCACCDGLLPARVSGDDCDICAQCETSLKAEKEARNA